MWRWEKAASRMAGDRRGFLEGSEEGPKCARVDWIRSGGKGRSQLGGEGFEGWSSMM